MEEVIKLFLVACRGQTQAQQVEVLEREISVQYTEELSSEWSRDDLGLLQRAVPS